MDYTLLVTAHYKPQVPVAKHRPATEDDYYASFTHPVWPVKAVAFLRVLFLAARDVTRNFLLLITNSLYRSARKTGL